MNITTDAITNTTNDLDDLRSGIDTGLPARPGVGGRLEFIDGLRAVAALFVVACHAYFEPANGYYKSRIMNHLGLTYGHISVDVFIVLSGFCLMLPIAKRKDEFGSVHEFFRRRIRRILPPYYAALILSIAFITCYANSITGTVWDNCLPLTWSTSVLHLLLLHDLPFHGIGGSINYPLWSIAVEFQLYLIMPLIVLSLRTRGNSITLLWTIVLGIVAHVIFRGYFDSTVPWYLGLFTMGAVAARQGIQRPDARMKPIGYIASVVALVVALTIVLKGKDFFDINMAYYDTVIGATAASLLYVTLLDSRRDRTLLTQLLSWKPLVFIGSFSYSLYLVHAPLLHLFDRILVNSLGSGPKIFIGLVASIPLVIGIAYLFHCAFERPFMRKA